MDGVRNPQLLQVSAQGWEVSSGSHHGHVPHMGHGVRQWPELAMF